MTTYDNVVAKAYNEKTAKQNNDICKDSDQRVAPFLYTPPSLPFSGPVATFSLASLILQLGCILGQGSQSYHGPGPYMSIGS